MVKCRMTILIELGRCVLGGWIRSGKSTYPQVFGMRISIPMRTLRPEEKALMDTLRLCSGRSFGALSKLGYIISY